MRGFIDREMRDADPSRWNENCGKTQTLVCFDLRENPLKNDVISSSLCTLHIEVMLARVAENSGEDFLEYSERVGEAACLGTRFILKTAVSQTKKTWVDWADTGL